MKFSRFIREKSYLRGLIYSYCAVILVLFLIYFTTYSVMLSAVERERESSSIHLIENARDNVDNEISMITQLANFIASNDKMLKSFSSKNPSEFIYEDYEDMVFLKNVKITSEVIDEIYIYNKNRDKIISSLTTVPLRDFYDAKHSSSGYSFEEWKELLDGAESRLLTQLPRSGNSADVGDSSNYIAYVQPLPISAGKEKDIKLVILINAARLTERTGMVGVNNGGQFAVLDKDGKALVSVGGLVDKDNADELESGIIKIDKKKYSVNTIKSNVVSWKYVMITPCETYMDKVHIVKTVAIVCMLLYIAVGCIMVYIFSRKNYRPLEEIIKTLNIKPDGKGANEFGVIKKNIQDMQKEYNQLLLDSSKGQRQRCESYYKSVLEGRDSAEALFNPKIMKKYDFEPISDSFAVLLVKIENLSELSEMMSMRLDTAQFALSNVICELMDGKGIKCYTTTAEGGALAAIINFPEGMESVIAPVSEVIKDFSEFFKYNYDMTLYIGISSVSESVYDIESCYYEALQAMKYRIVAGSGAVVFYSDIEDKRMDYVYTSENEREITAAVSGGDYKRAEKVIDYLFDTNVFSRRYSARAVQAFIFELERTLIKIIPQSLIINVTELDKTAEEIKARLLESVEEYCTAHSKTGQQNIGDSITAYINENYSNPDLSVNMLGDKFGLSPSYLSKLFREQTGEGLLGYIYEAKMKYAEELLAKGVSIEKTAEAVGYTNGSSFARAYKKLRGITPKQFKRGDNQ